MNAIAKHLQSLNTIAQHVRVIAACLETLEDRSGGRVSDLRGLADYLDKAAGELAARYASFPREYDEPKPLEERIASLSGGEQVAAELLSSILLELRAFVAATRSR